jgi:hypothetical protein
MLGIAERDEIGAESSIEIGALPPTPVAPLRGEIATTCSDFGAVVVARPAVRPGGCVAGDADDAPRFRRR